MGWLREQGSDFEWGLYPQFRGGRNDFLKKSIKVFSGE